MRKVFDVIRQMWVAATPEEIVRQTWIQRMIGDLRFPKELLAVEKELKALPHLIQRQGDLPSRRIDLLSFMKIIEELKPLLLIECKEASLTEEALDQVVAYNHYVKAPFVAVVNRCAIRFRYQLASDQHEITWLPSYSELMRALHG